MMMRSLSSFVACAGAAAFANATPGDRSNLTVPTTSPKTQPTSRVKAEDPIRVFMLMFPFRAACPVWRRKLRRSQFTRNRGRGAQPNTHKTSRMPSAQCWPNLRFRPTAYATYKRTGTRRFRQLMSPVLASISPAWPELDVPEQSRHGSCLCHCTNSSPGTFTTTMTDWSRAALPGGALPREMACRPCRRNRI